MSRISTFYHYTLQQHSLTDGEFLWYDLLSTQLVIMHCWRRQHKQRGSWITEMFQTIYSPGEFLCSVVTNAVCWLRTSGAAVLVCNTFPVVVYEFWSAKLTELWAKLLSNPTSLTAITVVQHTARFLTKQQRYLITRWDQGMGLPVVQAAPSLMKLT